MRPEPTGAVVPAVLVVRLTMLFNAVRVVLVRFAELAVFLWVHGETVAVEVGLGGAVSGDAAVDAHVV